MRSVPADSSLERLNELFPSSGTPEFVAHAAREMFNEALSCEDGELLHVRYWPGRGCVLLWAFPGFDGRPRFLSGRLFSGKHGDRVVQRGSFERLLASARATNVGIEDPYRFLADRHLLLLAFPMDGRLGGLPAADSDHWLRSSLCPVLGLRSEGVTQIERRAVSYKPWRRCVFHYRVHDTSGRHGFFAKVFRDDRGERLLERVAQVLDGLDARAGWDTPRAAAYFPGEKILVFEELEGALEVRDLFHEARHDAGARELLLGALEQAGAAAGKLRELPIEGLPSLPPRAMLDGVRKRMKGINRVAPELAETLTRELDRLGEEAERLRPEPLVPTHGALRHDQLLLHDGRIAILDLDGLCLSGRSADAGHFLGFLDMAAVRRPRQRELATRCEEAFLAGVKSAGGADLEWTAWHRAAARLKKTTRSFLCLDRKWPESAEAFRAGLRKAEPSVGGIG